MTVAITVAVIPWHPREGGGQAGIQTIDKARTQWDSTQTMALLWPLRGDLMTTWIPSAVALISNVVFNHVKLNK
jgi:hypothetical protein